VPRRSTRNLLAAMAGAEIDDLSVGPDVSDAIQMVYQVDDLAKFTRGTYGFGGLIGAAVGEHAMLQLFVDNPAGAIIDSAMNSVEWGAGATIQQAVRVATTTRVGAPPIIGAAAVNLAISEGPQSQSVGFLGTILAADVPADAFTFSSNHDPIRGLFVRGGQVLVMMGRNLNEGQRLSVMWTELNRS